MDDDERKLKEDEILDKVKKFRADAIAGSANLFDRMKKADDFKNGYQWDPAIKSANERKGKFCLTIPLVKPTIKQVCGMQIQNPKDLKVFNTKSGSATAARILTALSKHARDSEHVHYETAQYFEAGASTGVGVMGIFVDKNEDPKHGNLRIEKLNEHECCFDPNCNVYDPNTPGVGCQYVIWEPWVIKEEVEAEYPAKKKELQALGSGNIIGLVMGSVQSFIDWMVGSSSEKATSFSMVEREDTSKLERYRYQKSHTWWVEHKRCVMLYDSRRSELDAVLCLKEEKISRARKAAERWPDVFSIEDVVRPIIHHTIRVGDVFLEDIEDELNGVMMYPLVPFYAYFDNGYKSGMAEDCIGTQEEINWTHSMILNIVKKLANTGWVGSRIGDQYKRFLEVHGGEDGVILEKDKAGGELEKIKPNDFPAGLFAFSETCKENMKLVTNVRTEDPTTDKDRVAAAIMLKQRAAQSGHASVFMNFDYSLSIANNLIVEIIRHNDIYSEDEIREVVDKEELIDKDLMDQARQMIIESLKQSGLNMPETIGPPDVNILQGLAPEIQHIELAEYQEILAADQELARAIDEAARPIAEAMLFDEIRNFMKGRYNTKVSMSPMSPTYRMAKSAELFELNKTLVENRQLPISRRKLIEATDIQDKEEIIAEEQQMAGAAT